MARFSVKIMRLTGSVLGENQHLLGTLGGCAAVQTSFTEVEKRQESEPPGIDGRDLFF